jgi:uncharacterized membrane protein
LKYTILVIISVIIFIVFLVIFSPPSEQNTTLSVSEKTEEVEIKESKGITEQEYVEAKIIDLDTYGEVITGKNTVLKTSAIVRLEKRIVAYDLEEVFVPEELYFNSTTISQGKICLNISK